MQCNTGCKQLSGNSTQPDDFRPWLNYSVYLRDPSGYVIELTAKRSNHEEAMDPECTEARAKLNAWTAKISSDEI